MKKIFSIIIAVLFISFLSFALMRLAPGDPTIYLIDPTISLEDVRQLKEQLGVDQPFFKEYVRWLSQIMKGNLGRSMINGQLVLDLILERLPATLLLTTAALLVTLVLGLILGVFSVTHQNSWIDKLIVFLTYIGMSTPTFWLALLMMLLFGLKLGWFPVLGMQSALVAQSASLTQKTVDILWHMVLPVVTMSIGSLASITKYMRDNLIKILDEDYILTAKAYGFSHNTILYKYAMKNALLPVITILGLSLPGLFGGAFIIEKIFSWPGMGRLGVDAIFARDYPLIMGILLFSSILIILGNFLADWMYKKVDPRIQYGGLED